MEWEEFINCLQLVMCVGNINSEQHIPILQVRQYSLMVIQINPIPLFMEVGHQRTILDISKFKKVLRHFYGQVNLLIWLLF